MTLTAHLKVQGNVVTFCSRDIEIKPLDKNYETVLMIRFTFLSSNRRVCTICEFGQQRQFYSLRGLCSESRHDRQFTWERTTTTKPFLKGLSFSTITWVIFAKRKNKDRSWL